MVSTFVGFGLYIRQGSSSTSTVAEVNEEKVPYRLFLNLYNQVIGNRRDQRQDINPDVLKQVKQEVMQGLIQESVFYQESKRYGIEVTDTELAQALASIPAFQKDGKFDVGAYAEALRYRIRSTPEDFEESQRRQIAINRLRMIILQGIKITNPELEQDFALYLQSLQGKEREETLKNFEKDRSGFLERIRQQETAEVLNRWYQQLGSRVKVKVHLDQIEKRMATQ